jgi:CRP/FNR family transcriptional regulator, cyclic AMP receptor protein
MAKDIRDNLVFAGIEHEYVDTFLASLPPPIHLKKEQFLWRQDDSGDSMYLLIRGKLEVIIHTPKDEDMMIANIDTGAVIGEVCVLGEKTRSASIRAIEDSELLKVDGKTFQQKIAQKDVGVLQMCYNIAKLLTQRLVISNNFIRKLEQIADKAVVSELEHYRQRFFEESLFN